MTDRDANPSSQPYELFMFARKHGLPLQKARKIIDEHGCDRVGSDAAAIAYGAESCLPDMKDCRSRPADSDFRRG